MQGLVKISFLAKNVEKSLHVQKFEFFTVVLISDFFKALKVDYYQLNLSLLFPASRANQFLLKLISFSFSFRE